MHLMNSLFNKYKNISTPIKASLWVTVCNFLQRGISMITTPIFTRGLSTYEYGVASTYYTWNSLIYMITSLCIYKSLMNLYIKYDNKEKTLTYLLGLELSITLFWIAIILLFRQQFSLIFGLNEFFVIMLAISSFSQGALDCWMIYKRYIYDYRSVVFASIFQSTLSTVIAAILVFFVNPSAELRITPQIVISLIIAVCIYISYFIKQRVFFDKQVWTFAISFCGALMPHYLSEFVLNASDKLMINAMCSKTDVAVYSIAYSVGSLVLLITSAINVSFSPYRYQKIKEGDYKKLSSVTTKVLCIVCIFLILIMMLGYEIVYIFGGKKYLDATTIIVPISLGVFFNYMFQIFAGVQEYYEKKGTIVFASVFCAITNIVLNYIFIKIFGYKAASYTTFFCYALFCFVHYLFYRNLCKKQLNGVEIYNIKQLAVISIAIIVIGILVSILNHFIILKYCMLLLMIVFTFCNRKRILGFAKDLFN